MLFSKKSPVFAKGLNIFFRILYLSPCYIYIVSALGTPTFMAIPIIYIWAGRFPAVLTSTVISWMIAYTVMSYVIKCYVRPGRNYIHDFRYTITHCCRSSLLDTSSSDQWHDRLYIHALSSSAISTDSPYALVSKLLVLITNLNCCYTKRCYSVKISTKHYLCPQQIGNCNA